MVEQLPDPVETVETCVASMVVQTKVFVSLHWLAEQVDPEQVPDPSATVE